MFLRRDSVAISSENILFCFFILKNAEIKEIYKLITDNNIKFIHFSKILFFSDPLDSWKIRVLALQNTT